MKMVKLDNLKYSVREVTQVTIQSMMNEWLQEHPLFNWILHHPIATLVLVVISIVLLLGLLQAIFRLIEKFWLTVLKSPLLLGKLLLGSRTVKSREMAHPSGVVSDLDTEQISQILVKLETIQQEQQAILQELAALRNQAVPTLRD